MESTKNKSEKGGKAMSETKEYLIKFPGGEEIVECMSMNEDQQRMQTLAEKIIQESQVNNNA